MLLQLVKIEEEYEEKKRQCEQLEEELNSLKQEYAKTEHDLTTEITELQPHSEQLKVSDGILTCSDVSYWPCVEVEAEEKKVHLNEAKEKLEQLNARIEVSTLSRL